MVPPRNVVAWPRWSTYVGTQVRTGSLVDKTGGLEREEIRALAKHVFDNWIDLRLVQCNFLGAGVCR